MEYILKCCKIHDMNKCNRDECFICDYKKCKDIQNIKNSDLLNQKKITSNKYKIDIIENIEEEMLRCELPSEVIV